MSKKIFLANWASETIDHCEELLTVPGAGSIQLFFFFCTILSFADYSIKAMASLVGTSVHVSSTLLRTALFLFGDKKKTCEPARPKLPTSFLVGRVVGRFPEVPIIQLIGFPYCKEGLSACRLANQLTSPADFPTIVS